MNYTFYARSYENAGDALVAFDKINRQMQGVIPDAFLSAYESDAGHQVVLLGCSDDDRLFTDTLTDAWGSGQLYTPPVDVCMAMEARHSRLLREHADNDPENDLVMTRIAPATLMADGTIIDTEDNTL